MEWLENELRKLDVARRERERKSRFDAKLDMECAAICARPIAVARYPVGARTIRAHKIDKFGKLTK
jgi:hypothetical protein